MKTFRTLCSGGELFGVGARAAGWQHVDGWEIEAPIAAVARLNGFAVNVADVCRIDYTALPYADHLHASPSCKTASQANTDGGEADEDKAVADAVCRAIRAHRGATFSLENVWAYRNYESFARILAALHGEGFTVDYRHVNSADYGVPQTRKRLILRAVRGARVPPLHPTHRKGGDMFHAAWRGWYEAIEDLLPGLPDTTPAPWQMARLSEEPVTMLVAQGCYGDRLVTADPHSPAFTMTANSNQSYLRAFLMRDDNTKQEWGKGYRADDEPSPTVRTDGNPRAFLVGDQAGSAGKGIQIVDAALPAFSVRASATGGALPMVASGTWKRLTVQTLGRFQTVPDDYIGLTPQINGNGVPCLLAQRIMESLR